MDADRIRIAIALAALKHKPSDLSFHSYVLDLQAKFQPSTPSAPTADRSWRTYALSLERDHAELQVMYDAEKIKSLALASASLAVPQGAVLTGQSDRPAVKKKAKKKSVAFEASPLEERMSHFSQIDHKSALEKLHDRMVFPTFPEPDSLFSALKDVLLLTTLSDIEPNLLLSTVVRTVEAVAKILQGILVRQPTNLSADCDVLNMLSILFHHVLSGVLPLLVAHSQHSTDSPDIPSTDLTEPVTVLLDKFTTLIFHRLIQAFVPLSETYLSALFLRPIPSVTTPPSIINSKPPTQVNSSTQPSPVDIRADVLSVFQTLFSALDSQLYALSAVSKSAVVVRTLRACLILNAVRELERLLAPDPARLPGSNNEVHSGITLRLQQDTEDEVAERVKKLATKDAFWYLCTILHILFSESSASDPSASRFVALHINHEKVEGVRAQGNVERLLNESISDALLKLIATCRTSAASRHHGYHKAEPRAREVYDRDREKGMEKGKHSNAWVHSPDGREDEGQHLTESSAHGYEPLHDISTDGIDGVGVNSHVHYDGVGAGGSMSEDDGKRHDMWQHRALTADPLEGCGSHDMIDLDEVSYEMLLGLVERYWAWSRT